MSAHPLQWQTPAPLWTRFGNAADAASADDQRRPALLRFASDDFMEQILGLLARDPQQLDTLLARPETWRKPMADAADSVERVAVPRAMRAISRLRLQAAPKAAVAAVADSAAVLEKTQPRTLPLKLYQPAHQRYYLVGASLVCGVGGLPERALQRAGEDVGFVIRRLLPETPNDDDAPLREFAFIKDANDGRWQRVAMSAEAGTLAAGEELLPLFPLAFRDQADRARTLWSGFVPVARREDYLGASIDRSAPSPLLDAQRAQLQPQTPTGPVTAITARKTQFMMEVAEPWKVLVRAVLKARGALHEGVPEGMDGSGESSAATRARVLTLNLQWQMQSWLILLDFADYLATHLPDLWQALQSGDATGLSAKRKALYDWLGDTTPMTVALQDALRIPAGNLQIKPAKNSLRAALTRIVDFRVPLEQAQRLYGLATRDGAEWPDFHFLLAGLDSAGALAGACTTLSAPSAADAEAVPADPVGGGESLAEAGARAASATLDSLTAMLARCLDAQVESEAPPPPFALQLRDAYAATSGDAGWFVIRCVHRNRDCGPLHPATLSAPTQRFQLASFFDADAPARPIRITLPLDTTPAGLRKYSKNTAFVISDVLCGQIQRAKGLGLGDLVRSVLPWPLHKDLDVGDGGACSNGGGVNIGMICSLSIPIITICALLMLMIIVSLLDFIFRWLPYFVFCFPVPGLKGKKA